MNNIYLKFYEENTRKIHEDEFSTIPEDMKYLIHTNDGYYQLKNGVDIGKVDKKERFAFLLKEGRDLFLNPDEAKDLLNNDIVLTRSRKGKTYLELILKRGLETIVARAFKNKRGFKYYTKEFLGKTIVVDNERLVVDGSIVKLKVISIKNTRIYTELEYVVGHITDPGVDIEVVLAEYNWPNLDMSLLEKEAEKLDVDLTDEFKKRVDLTNKLIVTIDSESAKDLDDAVSLEVIDGNYHLGVHIADVTHYVTKDSKIDKAAYIKATSAYLANKVVPMLPRKLSNDLCSLNPNETKLTVSCNMVIDSKGKVIDYEIVESFIESKHRLSYNGCNDLIYNNKSLGIKEVDELVINLNKLSYILKDVRKNRGELEFKTDELEFVIDEDENVVDVLKRKQLDAEELIESMMLIANETVAFHMEVNELPSIYRIHESPETEKLELAMELLAKLGINFDRKGIANVKELQKVLVSVLNTNIEEIVNNTLLRSMQRAEYSDNPIGHFGLSARYYTHFTSPIRRYPDLLLHRLIKDFVLGKDISLENYNYYEKTIADIASHSSKMERVAIDMEREVIKMKSCEYLADKIGEVYESKVTSIIKSGLFVKLENGIEGFIRTFDNDINNDKKVVLVSKVIDGVRYNLGDKMTVKLIDVDMIDYKIDFKVYKEEEDISESYS